MLDCKLPEHPGWTVRFGKFWAFFGDANAPIPEMRYDTETGEFVGCTCIETGGFRDLEFPCTCPRVGTFVPRDTEWDDSDEQFKQKLWKEYSTAHPDGTPAADFEVKYKGHPDVRIYDRNYPFLKEALRTEQCLCLPKGVERVGLHWAGNDGARDGAPYKCPCAARLAVKTLEGIQCPNPGPLAGRALSLLRRSKRGALSPLCPGALPAE